MFGLCSLFLIKTGILHFGGGLWLNVYLYYGIASLEASIQLGEGEGFWMHWYHIPMLPQSWIISSHSCKVKHTSSSSYLRTVFATIWKVDSFILSNTLHHSVLEEMYSSYLKSKLFFSVTATCCYFLAFWWWWRLW